MKEMVEEIKSDKLIQKYIYKYTWVSGENTQVFPITIYMGKKDDYDTIKEITIQIETKRNYFKKLIERYQQINKSVDSLLLALNDDLSGDFELLELIEEEFLNVEKEFNSFEIQTLLTGPYDKNNVIQNPIVAIKPPFE